MNRIAGVDEVGRGPLAGPVTAAAVLFAEDEFFPSFTDSKKLSEKKRETLFEEIIESCSGWAIVSAGPKTIDRINIRQATHLCMKEAIEHLRPAHAFIDGNMAVETSIPQTTIIKGDAKHFAIGAASIIAKVWRDRLLNHYEQIFPGYGLQKHKGYPSAVHRKALEELGPSIIHRYSYKTVSVLAAKGPQASLCDSTGDLLILSSIQGDDPKHLPTLGTAKIGEQGRRDLSELSQTALI